MSAVKRALISVSDKRGVAELAGALVSRGIQILSTGGTASLLRASGVPVIEVSEITGFPEVMDGRVKTLHPAIHGGLLGRRGIDDAVMAEHGMAPIDLLVVNLYPFRETIARPGCTIDDAIENIDIGGPAMIRAAAKNHADVAVVVDPEDYPELLGALTETGGEVPEGLRRRLAARAFGHTAAYDAAIAAYLNGREEYRRADGFPHDYAVAFEKRFDLRYGENPHQRAAFYAEGPGAPGIGGAEQLQGKDLSYNNIADADAALECVRQFDEPACVIVKHANPCGVALATDIGEAYRQAYSTDPTSAFGGIIAFNRPLDRTTAAAIVEQQFVEVVVAPEVDDGAAEALAAKKNVRVLRVPSLSEPPPGDDLKRVAGGLLVQTRDDLVVSGNDLRIVTKRAPTEAEMIDLLFAWKVVKFVKSNAIVFARDRMTVGIGAGQMSRVYSTRIAAIKAADAGLQVAGSVMASDAFFPFRDGVDAGAEHGIRAIIQPGGSIRDEEVVAAADEHGLAMAFTGARHFRH